MVELKNIKRSYMRLLDMCMGTDMGWLNDRPECMYQLRKINSVSGVIFLATNLVSYLKEYDYPQEEIDRATRWCDRWTRKIA